MSAALVVGFFVAYCCTWFSLWENPRPGRSTPTGQEGVFHRLLVGLGYWALLALNFVVSEPTKFLYWLHCRDLLPMWVVNIPFHLVPEFLRRPMSRAWLKYCENKQGGKP